MMRRLWLAVAAVFALVSPAFAEDMPTFVKQGDRFALMVDGKPFFMMAAQLHNSSAWPAQLDKAWPAALALSPNVVQAPVYWEQFEPRSGVYDTTNVDALIAKARATHVRLTLLWFGTWKNGEMHYVPEWMQSDRKTYPRMLNERGEPVSVLSPNVRTNVEADKRAFTALMRHLKKVDGDQHTVIVVQVENEPGAIGSVRDFGAEAQSQFNGAVPQAVLDKLSLKPGTWREVFGPDADEAFGAWSTAHYINEVAAAGKAVYPLPLYVNTWLRYKDKKYPGIDYPSGGATFNVFDIWRSVSPAVDFIGTDIYTSDAGEYRKVLDQYARPDNPSWVSETGFDANTASFLYYVLDRGGVGFSTFGVDNDPASEAHLAAAKAHGDNYKLLAPIQDLLGQALLDKRVKASVEEPGRGRQALDFGDWRVDLSYGPPPWGELPAIVPNSKDGLGRALVIQLDATTYLISGVDVRFEFKRVAKDGLYGRLARVEEGAYDNGVWKPTRWLNGDETDYGINFRKEQKLLRVTLGTY
ncbi:hypothetical protein AEAC466_05370 [Asticcacaulis sp. AC466]|uniref:DUF5597 domain-containing protein n=1 Tax=Asticcacaulis sp. AC466 TaxID=1282362 RepID=UPI0003C3CB46|nr:DUF5597 domain-containing protein [Asticcacaulis sp. AC466]ESQ85142.1 hypothetical protein AEAC466_05370 [Asticcacaulis sp. AC466]